ncbi:MAG: hypothetical protein ACRDK5_11855 [Solirubrobacterales bacterium]
MSTTGDYILGVVGLLAIAVSMAIAGRTVRRAALPDWTGAPALLADGILAIGILIVISELLGLLGILDGVLLVAACVIVGGGGVRMEPLLVRAARSGRAEHPESGQRAALPVSPIEIGIAVALALLVAAQWAGPTLLALDRGIYGGDSLWYHMPFAAHIAQTGSVTELLYVDPLYLNWFYPQNSELLHAGGLLQFGNDFLSPLLNLGWLGLALLAAWCVGRPYGAGAPTVAAVAALMSANLLFSRQPGNANNDVVAIAFLVSSVAILLNTRWLPGALPVGALVVAGLVAGLSLGTKLTVVPPVLALSVGVILIAGAGERLRAGVAWVGALLVGGGLWYGRNLVVSGTPFPFVDIGPLTKPEELEGRHPYSIVHYLTDTDVWGRFFRPALEERLGELWPLYLAIAVAAVVFLLIRGPRVERMLAAVAALAAIAYLLTPLGASGQEGAPVGFRLNIRYLAPGLALALVLIPIAAARLPGPQSLWRWGSLVIFAALTVVSSGAVEQIDGDRIPGTALLALVVIGLPVAFFLLARSGVPREVLAGVGAVALIALAFAGRIVQEDYLERRYSSAAPDYPRSEQPAIELGQGLGAAYDWARGTRNQGIALSGTTGALFGYGLWGEDSSNDVRYLGERGDRGSFRAIAECPEWVSAINHGDFDYVVTTPEYHQDDPEAATVPRERAWIDADPRAQRIAGAGLVDVWQLGGPLDPAACADAVPPGEPISTEPPRVAAPPAID